MVTIGSLFSGAGGLDMAVEEVFGGETVWHCEVDPAASKVLAYRWPDVPNLGDITAVDWSAVEPVDVLCGGFPCQDVSAAGRRAGIRTGTRSGLWAVYAEAIAVLRPAVVVIENVRGLLNAEAHRAVESADAVVGDGPGRPVLRAAGAVLGDLADLGYDAQWATVSAASVGAPHRRERVFIVATHPRHGTLAERPWTTRREGGQRSPVGPIAGRGGDDAVALIPTPLASDAGPRGGTTGFGLRDWSRGINRSLLPTPQAGDGNGGKTSHPDQRRANNHSVNLPEVARHELLPTPVARDFKGHGPSDMDRHSPNLSAISSYLLPTPNASDGTGGGQHPDRREGHSQQLIDQVLAPEQWGKYAPAIARWEAVTRPAPPPTEPNKNGNPRLSAAFSEWLMGWPAGWVTQVPGISRNDQLRIVGNGVCVLQASEALRRLALVAQEAV